MGKWDPIGLVALGEAWDQHSAVNEYDRYLLEAADRPSRDWSVVDATKYLMRIERDHMGMGVAPTARARAEATAKAVQAYLERLASEP